MKAQVSSNVTAASIISVLDLVMKFPSDLAMLGKQLASLPCMSTLDMIVHVCSHLATILATDETVLPVLEALEERFLLQLGKQANISQRCCHQDGEHHGESHLSHPGTFASNFVN